MTKKSKALPPGTPAPVSGQYEEKGPRGGGTGAEVTAIEGRPLPPTSKPGNKYDLVDRTKHKGSK